jgi:hypothetical protein
MANSGVLMNLAKRLHRLDVERRAIVTGIKAATAAMMDLPAARAKRRAKQAPRKSSAGRKTGPGRKSARGGRRAASTRRVAKK